MCVRYFNEIEMEAEKQGGRPKQPRKLEAFNQMMRKSRLVDMGFNRQYYTWCNNREGNEQIKEILDRAIVNSEWIQAFAKSEVTHKLNIGSDH